MKKKLFIFLIFLILGISLFVGLILKTGLGTIWENLTHFSLMGFLLFLLLSLLNFGLYTWRWEVIIKLLLKKETNSELVEKSSVQPKLSFGRLFLHRMSSFGLSYLTPSAQTGGEPLRIMLLSHDHVPTKIGTTSVIIDKALEFATLFTFIGLGLFVALLEGSLPQEAQTGMGITLVVLVFAIAWFYYASWKDIGVFSSFLRITRLTRFQRIQNIEKEVKEIESQMSWFYKNHFRSFVMLILVSLVITSFLLLEHYLVAYFMGVRLTFFQTFLSSTIPYLAYVVPIPGGLGVLEGGHAAIFSLLGVNINAFVLVFIIRIRDLVFVLIGLVHASRQGLSMMKKAFLK